MSEMMAISRFVFIFFFKQKTAYEMRISDWSSDVCSSDLLRYGDIDKVEAIVADVNRMLPEHPGIEHDFFAFNFDPCGDFARKLFLSAFTVSTDYPDYLNVTEDILLKIAALVRKHGGELAVPARTLPLQHGSAPCRASRGQSFTIRVVDAIS